MNRGISRGRSRNLNQKKAKSFIVENKDGKSQQQAAIAKAYDWKKDNYDRHWKSKKYGLLDDKVWLKDFMDEQR